MHFHRVPVMLAVISFGLFGSLACSKDLASPSFPNAGRALTARADVSPETPKFLQPAPGSPGVANPVIGFYARKGQDRTVRMYYSAVPGARDSVVFVQFRVRASSLASLPDGTAIADGDSVLITMTLVDATNGIIDFQPSGLRFSATNPASLKISFAEANQDLNHDGVVNQQDSVLTRQLAIWRRESPSDPWIRLPSVVSLNALEVESAISGFSGYAIAY